MEPNAIFDLWLPILAAWISTHVLSTLAWTVLPHHKPEWKHLPYDLVEPATSSAATEAGGQYVLTEAADGDPDPSKCRGTLVIWSRPPTMGINIGLTLAFFFVVALTIGYLASIGLHPESPPLEVFRFTATIALLTHCLGGRQLTIWFRRRWKMDMLDGLAYALATGASFALLWPSA